MKNSLSYIKKSNLFQELFYLVGKMTHSDLIKQMEYLQVENKILRSKLNRNVKLSLSERQRIIKYGKPLGPALKNFLSIVHYDTYCRWIRESIIPKHKRSAKRTRGRPRTREQIRELIIKLAKENNWGYTRILGELKKLGILSLSRNTIKNILKENDLDIAPERAKDTWEKFLKRHFETVWACDFFTKTVWTITGQKTFHIMFFINVATRKVHIAGITIKPDKEWVKEIAKTVPFAKDEELPKDKRLLLRDGDGKYSKEFDEFFKKINFRVKKIPFRSPNLNPYAEGWVGTIKRECLDHFIVFGVDHLKHLVNEYVDYYNTVRPHSARDNLPLDYVPAKTTGEINSQSRLGGIIDHYYWG